MTLTSLFGGGHLARDPPSVAGNVDYYNIDRADLQGHDWKMTKMQMKKTKSTLSALTLLAFLFFLNLLLSCLKDTVQSGNPEIIVMPQQRVTRGVLSGQLTGAVAPPGGVQGDEVVDDEKKKKVAESSIWSRIVQGLHRGRTTNGSRVDAGRKSRGLDDDVSSEKKVADIWRRTEHRLHRGLTNESIVNARRESRGLDADDDDDEMSVETEEVDVETESKVVDGPRGKLWPCCSDATTGRANTAARGHDEDYETSLETPTVVFRYTTGGRVGRHTDVYRIPLGVEGWETVEDATPTHVDRGLHNRESDVQTEEQTNSEHKETTGQEYVLTVEDEDDSENKSRESDWEENPSGNSDDIDEEEGEEDEEGLIDVTQATPWKAVKALLRAIGRRVAGKEEGEEDEEGLIDVAQAVKALLRAIGRRVEEGSSVWEAVKLLVQRLGRRVDGKGWEESLQSLQIPGAQLFTVGDKLATYAMPIVRDTSTRLGLARCKELVVCETSRLSEMFADEEVTDIFHGVFKWIYGMKEPELRSIAKDGEKKNNCKHFVRRCKSETENRSWLPMIANLLDFFIT